MKIYCYAGSKSSSTYYDAFYLSKFSKKNKYILSSKYKPPKDRKAAILFTDPGTYCTYHELFRKHPNKTVCWWHGNSSTPNKGVQKRIKIARKWLPKCKSVIVSCDYGRKCVESIGVPSEMIHQIPLGVDMSKFKPLDKKLLRKKFKIPEDAFCVGSFQRDTDKAGGPKIIKGPDIFVDAMDKLRSIPNLFVLLSGRRRDYVKEHLRKSKIKFSHVYLDDYQNMLSLYNCLDCYLISSREEGGPKALMESVSCEVPVVTTHCGMADDVIFNGVNGFVCDIRADKLTEAVVKVHEGKISGIRETVRRFDYKGSIVGKYDELFKEQYG